jgi:hypothetical protein
VEDGRVALGERGNDRHAGVILQQRRHVKELVVPELCGSGGRLSSTRGVTHERGRALAAGAKQQGMVSARVRAGWIAGQCVPS